MGLHLPDDVRNGPEHAFEMALKLVDKGYLKVSLSAIKVKIRGERKAGLTQPGESWIPRLAG